LPRRFWRAIALTWLDSEDRTEVMANFSCDGDGASN